MIPNAKSWTRRIGTFTLALAFLAPALLVAMPVAAQDGSTACRSTDYMLTSRMGTGTLTPGKTAASQKPLPLDSGLMVTVYTSANAVWSLRDQATGAVWVQGETTMDSPDVVFTLPSPYTRICLEITNTDAIPLAFAYVMERIS